VHRHDSFPVPIHSPADFAAQLGYELGRITKTLLVRSTTGDLYAMVVSPMGRKIDFAAVARALGVKRVQIASPAELASLVGFPEKGVSPLGVEDLTVLLDDDLFRSDTILIGAGEPGVEIELSPADLAALTGGLRTALTIAETR
jgi:Cys-tRNA(Pro)/Cys-tRNA(Cys) deacylase